MLIGRDYRKLIYQSFGYGLYRFVAVWIIVAICASYGAVGQVVALGLIAVSIIVAGVVRGLGLMIEEQSRQDWRDRLANRIFYELFWAGLKSNDRAHLDINGLFMAAGQKAVADINKAAKNANEGDFEFLDKSWWHWVGGVLHFLGLLIGDVLYYGSALWVGSSIAQPT